jgi:Rrf2 family protein
MQITRAADYALRVMIYLAGMPPRARASRAELAEGAGCPRQFLSKILQRLTRAGLIISHRGNTGGFELPEAQRRASVLQVMEAIEGPIHLNLCLDPAQSCDRKDSCAFQSVCARAQDALGDVFRQATLEEMARSTIAGMPRGRAAQPA